MMKLINDFGSGWIASPSDIKTAIDALDPDTNSFTVLEQTDQVYLQTAYEDGGLVVERRDGSADRHFRAWHMGGSDRFEKAEVLRLFDAYYRKDAPPLTVEWRPYRLDGSTIRVSNIFRGFSPIKALILVALVTGLYLFNNLIRGALQ
jgi:hypothetical protein